MTAPPMADMIETTLADWFRLARRLAFYPREWRNAARVFCLWCLYRLAAWRYCRRWGVTRAELLAQTRNPWR